LSGRAELGKLLTQDVFTVAEQLLGWTLRSNVEGAVTAVTITETEAYAGSDDPASHAYRGKTARNATMFGRSGLLYVYRSYGIHWCMNVVVEGEGLAHAVLLRGGEPTEGVETMRLRRGRSDHLADGPGKLCQALGVTADHDGVDLRRGAIRLYPGPGLAGRRIVRTPRIGISKATDHLWRFVAVG
jgi:DNA-3-methyladenine glycosylase